MQKLIVQPKSKYLTASERVYKLVKKIPKGRVMTYGQIASTLKDKNFKPVIGITPRYVGYILHNNPDPKRVPCHRVVDKNGKLAEKYAYGGWKEQKRKLIIEKVKFRNKNHVDKRYLFSLNI